jgi:hypothetical protein
VTFDASFEAKDGEDKDDAAEDGAEPKSEADDDEDDDSRPYYVQERMFAVQITKVSRA